MLDTRCSRGITEGIIEAEAVSGFEGQVRRERFGSWAKKRDRVKKSNIVGYRRGGYTLEGRSG